MTALETSISTCWDFSAPTESETRFRDILENTTDTTDRAEVLTQLARSLGLRRKFEEAHIILDSVLQILERDITSILTTRVNHVRIRYHLERGRTFNSSNEKGEARKHFLLAIELVHDPAESNYLVDAEHMMGIVEVGEESLRWNEIAIATAEASADNRTRNWLGALLNNTGMTYLQMKNFQRAHELFLKSQAWHESKDAERGDGRSSRETLIAQWTVARALRGLGKNEEAIATLQAERDLWEKYGYGEDGYIFEELAENLLCLKHFEQSKLMFASAHDILSKDEWLKSNEPARLQRIQELSLSLPEKI